jgi:hypothetical protein
MRARFLSVALLTAGLGSAIQAQGLIAGNGLLTSRKGSVKIMDASQEKIYVKPREAFLPSGSSWSTDKKASAFLSLSNGVAIGIDASTQMSFAEYLQRPFDAKSQGFEYEPSESKLNLQLDSGKIAIASNRLSPFSEFRIKLPLGSLRLHKGTCVISHDDLGLHIWAIDGNLNYQYPDNESREFVTSGVYIRISDISAKRQQVAERKDKAEIDSETLKLVKATNHSSRRVFYKANETTGSAPKPVMVVRPDYFEQPTIRPYQFKD